MNIRNYFPSPLLYSQSQRLPVLRCYCFRRQLSHLCCATTAAYSWFNLKVSSGYSAYDLPFNRQWRNLLPAATLKHSRHRHKTIDRRKVRTEFEFGVIVMVKVPPSVEWQRTIFMYRRVSNKTRLVPALVVAPDIGHNSSRFLGNYFIYRIFCNLRWNVGVIRLVYVGVNLCSNSLQNLCPTFEIFLATFILSCPIIVLVSVL